MFTHLLKRALWDLFENILESSLKFSFGQGDSPKGDFEVSFLCLTIGSKKKECGLPVRNKDLVHDYKLAPILDDSTNYID